jgi:hypothetical protein
MTPNRVKAIRWLVATIIGFFLVRSRGTTDVDYFAAWGREVANGNLFNLYLGGPGGTFSYRLVDTFTGTIPYPPAFLYLLGLFSVIARFIGGESDLVFRMAANVLGITGTYIVLRLFQSYSPQKSWTKPSRYFVSACLLMFAPILGYQDAISLVFLLLGVQAVLRNKSYQAGFLFALSLLTKQLILIALPGIALYLVLNLHPKRTKIALQTGISFVFSSFLLLSPFLFMDNRKRVLTSLIESSNHAVLSANGANLGWLFTWVSRMRVGINLQTLEIGGSMGDSFDVSLLGTEVSARLICLSVMLFTISLVVIISCITRMRHFPIELCAVCSAVYLSYCCFGTGIHENHIYIGLALVTCADMIRNSKVSSLTHLGWLMMCLHLYASYGFGRSVDVYRFPPLVVQFIILGAFIVYVSLLLRSVLWIGRPKSRNL